MSEQRLHTAIVLGVPILMVGAAIYRRGWYAECAAPCFDIVTAPFTETFALAGGVAGIAGQIVLALVLFVWALFFVDPLLRGPI